jgi:hypothetical protein
MKKEISMIMSIFVIACFVGSFILFVSTGWEINSHVLGWLCLATACAFVVEGLVYKLSWKLVFAVVWLICGAIYLL